MLESVPCHVSVLVDDDEPRVAAAGHRRLELRLFHERPSVPAAFAVTTELGDADRNTDDPRVEPVAVPDANHRPSGSDVIVAQKDVDGQPADAVDHPRRVDDGRAGDADA